MAMAMASTAKGLDFARAVLENYGWKEGKGLGRNEDGISRCLVPKLKFDKTGFGHQGDSEQFTSRWWEQCYNKVANSITVVKKKRDVKVKTESTEELFKSKDTRPVSMYATMNYISFVKTSILSEKGILNLPPPLPGTDAALEEAVSVNITTQLSDEELFRACGGRTAHKGARHGLKLTGKLARIKRQEKLMLQNQLLKEEANVSDCKESVETNNFEFMNEVEEASTQFIESHEKRRKKNRKKSSTDAIENVSLKLLKDRKRCKLSDVMGFETLNANVIVNSTSILPLDTDTNCDDDAIKKKKKERKEIIIDSEINSSLVLEPSKKKGKKEKSKACDEMLNSVQTLCREAYSGIDSELLQDDSRKKCKKVKKK